MYITACQYPVPHTPLTGPSEPLAESTTRDDLAASMSLTFAYWLVLFPHNHPHFPSFRASNVPYFLLLRTLAFIVSSTRDVFSTHPAWPGLTYRLFLFTNVPSFERTFLVFHSKLLCKNSGFVPPLFFFNKTQHYLVFCLFNFPFCESASLPRVSTKVAGIYLMCLHTAPCLVQSLYQRVQYVLEKWRQQRGQWWLLASAELATDSE